MIENLNVGLQVTGLGMALVFLTLFICMLVIILLNRLFQAQSAAPEATRAPALAAVPAAPVVTGEEAAAIAVAIALQQRKAKPEAPSIVSRPTGEEIVGGVMIVKPIVPAPWSGAARKDN